MNLLEIKNNFDKNGYVILNIKNFSKKIDIINKKIQKRIERKNIKTNPSAFHYNSSPRIVEGWKFIKEIKQIAYDKELNKILKFLKNNKKPIPFSTINFIRGTEQPLHSDYIHFATTPDFYLVGVWMALEDINKNAGPLAIVEKSHKFPVLNNEKLKLKIPTNEKELKRNYTIYENKVKKILKKKKSSIKELMIKKGEIIIWDANLLHGAFKIKNKKLTRKSLVFHYHFSGCIKYYNPIYSLTSKNIYAERDLKKIKIQNVRRKRNN